MAATVSVHPPKRPRRPRRALTPHEIRSVAVKAGCHTGTVNRYLDDPTTTWSTSASRIEAALRELKLAEKAGLRP